MEENLPMAEVVWLWSLPMQGTKFILPNQTGDMLSDDLWEIIDDSGIITSSNDVEAAENAEITVLFTPFGKKKNL